MKREIGSVLPYILAAIFFTVIVIIIWDDQVAIAQISIIFAISALLYSLGYSHLKETREDIKRKHSLSIYKKNLLLKLNGTLSTIQWTLSSYISYGVASGFPTTKKINNMSLTNFRKIQFESYKIYYDEIRYFTTSEIDPIEIKDKLDSLKLEAEKLINFLHLYVG